MMMAQQTIMLHKDYLTLFEKCQLAYSYDKLVMGVKSKASLCRQIGIDWDSYYYMRYIFEKKYDQQEYKDKLEELKHRLSHEDKRQTSEKNRIRYTFKKVRKWDKEIKTIEGIPKTVKWLRSRGYSNIFIEYLIRNKKITKPFSLLQPCLCCGSRLCECEPNQHLHNGNQSIIKFSRWLDIDLADWMERDGLYVCGHHGERHQIGWITDGGITIPYECKDCDCYYNLSNKTSGDYKK